MLSALGLLIGFIGGGVVLVVYLLVTNSRWWHARHHAQQLNPFGCDRCYREWSARWSS